jgi:SnoaL-like domain
MSEKQSSPPAVRALVDATNSGDSEAFLDSFTAAGVVDDWGREFVGRDAIAGWNDNENIGVHSHFTVHQVTRDGSSYVATVTVKGNGYNGGGTFTFELDGDLVSRFTIR